jgi:hypothetical protein
MVSIDRFQVIEEFVYILDVPEQFPAKPLDFDRKSAGVQLVPDRLRFQTDAFGELLYGEHAFHNAFSR